MLPNKIDHPEYGTLVLNITADNKYIKAACYQKTKKIKVGYNQAQNFKDLYIKMVDFLEEFY